MLILFSSLIYYYYHVYFQLQIIVLITVLLLSLEDLHTNVAEASACPMYAASLPNATYIGTLYTVNLTELTSHRYVLHYMHVHTYM